MKRQGVVTKLSPTQTKMSTQIKIMIGIGGSMLVGEEIVVVAALSIIFKSVLPVSYSADVLSDVVVDVLIEALAGGWADLIIGVVATGIRVDTLVVIVDVNSVVAVVTALRCAKLVPVEEAFSC